MFVLSGAEDLVPVLELAGGTWNARSTRRELYGGSYRVDTYRPRIEGLFARIERWSSASAPGDVFWRSISKDNITTWYGRTEESRITDPSDPARIYSWLICESYDDKGNVMVYGYKAEDSQGISASAFNERNRTNLTRATNRYLKRIRYGNRLPYFPDLTLPEAVPLPDEWLFELVLDYGEHDPDEPRPAVEPRPWDLRNDPFSSYRAGFEVRTYRLCQRVVMFHHFPEEPDVGLDCLVRSTDLTYSYELDPSHADNPIYSFLLSATQNGYRRAPAGGYLRRSLPAVEFEYSRPIVSGEVRDLDPLSLENLPVGLDGSQYQWVDLDGEGLSGIMSQQAGAYYYKPNLSPVAASTAGTAPSAVEFGPTRCVAQQPSLAGKARQQWLDLAGDGQLDLVCLDGPTPGFSERSDDDGWAGFKPFDSLPQLDWGDGNLRFVDLTGDGHADVLITEDDAFCWYASLGGGGLRPGRAPAAGAGRGKRPPPGLCRRDPVDLPRRHERRRADRSGADPQRRGLLLAQSGLWPLRRQGRPWTTRPGSIAPDQFDQSRIRLADIDGSGMTDILYLAADGVTTLLQPVGQRLERRAQAGRRSRRSTMLPPLHVADLLGNGTACLVWSSPLPGDARRPMRYMDLMGGQKPHLLVATRQQPGRRDPGHYAPSTKFYLADDARGQALDHQDAVSGARAWSGSRPTTTSAATASSRRYAYHHGYFDGMEREFRGFGMVEQWDTEEYAALGRKPDIPTGDNIDASSHVPPVLTRTWFHTGAYLGGQRISNYFAGLLDAKDIGEYYREPGLDDAEAQALLLPDTILPEGLTPEEEREACRALKGAMLRQEVYALDGTRQGAASLHRHRAELHHAHAPTPRAGNRHAVFFYAPARGDQLSLRTQSRRSAHRARADPGSGRVRQRAAGRPPSATAAVRPTRR